MGLSQGKQEADNSHNAIAIAKVENLSTQVESKLNYVGIGLIILGVCLCIFFCYFVRSRCKQCAKAWVQKTVGNMPPTAIRIHGGPLTPQQNPQQQQTYQ